MVGGPVPGPTVTLPGRVRAREEVTLGAMVGGRLTGLPFVEGARFGRGQTLARFDAPELRLALEAAQARTSSAVVRLRQARLQESRMDSLFAARVAALREVELAQSDRASAEAEHAAARAALDQLATASALPAPFAGVVVRHRVDVGTTVTPGQPLLDLRSNEVGEIEVAVPESELGRVARARLSYQSEGGPWRGARLARLDGMTDPASRTRVARLRPATGDALDPGAYVRVRLEADTSATRGETAGGGTVPATAVVRRGALTGVFVLREGRATLRWIRLGRPHGEGFEVLAGLSAGETVAVDASGLRDGIAVRWTP
jgi:RND family efflux transporter MFP subunit